MYDKTKEKEEALKHVQLMDSVFSDAIDESACATVIYKDKSFYKSPKVSGKMEINLTDRTTADAIMANAFRGKMCALNFASFKQAGGKYLSGDMAQEEHLCSRSTLYNVLREFDQTYYAKNREYTNKLMYANKALYTPNVVFVDDNANIAYADIITCAAPNKKGALRYRGVTAEENSSALLSRIDFVLSIAEHHRVKNLILGAYGCGVFGQNPMEVAEMFHRLLKRHNSFDYVEFAIPNQKSVNYCAFELEFGGGL